MPLLLTSGLLLLCGLQALPPTPVAREERRVLIHGGRIRLGDGKGTQVEALLAVDGRVVQVGTEESVLAAAGEGELERIDLQGATAVPGLQDAHAHIRGYGESLELLDVRGCESYEELLERVKARAAATPTGEWVIGRGWDQTAWEVEDFPHHAALSELVPDHPVFLGRVDGHAALVNARALELAGLGKLSGEEPDVTGGRVHLDAEGEASGILIDEAMGLVRAQMPEETREQKRRRILAAQSDLLAFGLTCVHDMGAGPETIAVYKELAASGELRLRVVLYLWGNDGLTDEDLEGLPLVPGERDLLSIPGVKVLLDGALGSRGAALLEDYTDAPGERGELLVSEQRLTELVLTCARRNLQPAVHAIGDRANRVTLDVFERVMAVQPELKQLRPRIEHAQVVAPRDWERFPALGVIPSMQPTHATSDMDWVEERLGPDRAQGAYAWRRLAQDVTDLAFGSDFPVESPNPLLGMYAARTRADATGLPEQGFLPDQRLEGEAALAAFTSGAAHAVHQETRRGRLLPGFHADLSVLTVDPVACEPAELLDARVLLTIIEGEVVYASDAR